jgi:hypothetical protein
MAPGVPRPSRSPDGIPVPAPSSRIVDAIAEADKPFTRSTDKPADDPGVEFIRQSPGQLITPSEATAARNAGVTVSGTPPAKHTNRPQVEVDLSAPEVADGRVEMAVDAVRLSPDHPSSNRHMDLSHQGDSPAHRQHVRRLPAGGIPTKAQVEHILTSPFNTRVAAGEAKVPAPERPPNIEDVVRLPLKAPRDLAEVFQRALIGAAAGRITDAMLEHLATRWTPADSTVLGDAADTLAAVAPAIRDGLISESGVLNAVREPLRPFLGELLGIGLDAVLHVVLPPPIGLAVRALRVADVAGAFLSGEGIAPGYGLKRVAECRSAKALAGDLAGEAVGDKLNQALEQHSTESLRADQLEAQRRAVEDAFVALRQDIERRRKVTLTQHSTDLPGVHDHVPTVGPPRPTARPRLGPLSRTTVAQPDPDSVPAERASTSTNPWAWAGPIEPAQPVEDPPFSPGPYSSNTPGREPPGRHRDHNQGPDLPGQ